MYDPKIYKRSTIQGIIHWACGFTDSSKKSTKKVNYWLVMYDHTNMSQRVMSKEIDLIIIIIIACVYYKKEIFLSKELLFLFYEC